MKTAQTTALIKSHMSGWKKTNRTEADCQQELTTLADALINCFERDRQTTGLTPSTLNVASIIVDEMSKWTSTTADFAALSARLCRYFTIFHAEPVQLDGLPGGHPVSELAVGRHSAHKAVLLASTTGIVPPR